MAYFISRIVYALYISPLSAIPGPKINAISRVPYARHVLRGSTVDNVVALHEKYGEAVRLSPNEVSFISGETAWADIYGFRTGKMKGRLNMQKVNRAYCCVVRAELKLLGSCLVSRLSKRCKEHSDSGRRESRTRTKAPITRVQRAGALGTGASNTAVYRPAH